MGEIKEYIAAQPKTVQPILRKLHATIKSAAPKAEESISYKIPTFKLNNSVLIYFAAWKTHIGMYPVPLFDDGAMKALAKYRAAKGTLRFPLDEPLPLPAIKKLVSARVKELSAEKKASPAKKKPVRGKKGPRKSRPSKQ